MKLAGKVALNVSLLSAGRLLNSITGVVAVAIAARYLRVEAYGALITAIAFTAVIGSLTDLGTSTIAAREIAKRPHEKRLLLRVVFSVNILLAGLAMLVGLVGVLLFYRGAAHHFEREAILLLLAPTLILPAASTVGVYFLVEQKNYLGMLASVAGSLALLVMVALTEAFDWGFIGVAGAYAVNGAVFSIAMIGLGLKYGVPLRPSRHRTYFKQILRWALPLAGAIVITALYWRLDVLLLSLIAGDDAVGTYGLAFKIVDVLVTVPLFMMLTLLPEFARLAEHRDRFEEIMQKAFSVMQAGAAPLLVFMVVFAAPVVDVVGGHAFRGAVPILQILMLGVATSYLAAVSAQGLIALNQQRMLFVLSLFGLLINGMLNAALIPLWSGIGAAIAYVLTEFAAIGMTLWQLHKSMRIPRPVHAVRFLLACGLMASVGLLQLVPAIDHLPSIVVLAILGPLSGAVYIGSLYALRAVPPVLHESLLLPLWERLRGRRGERREASAPS